MWVTREKPQSAEWRGPNHEGNLPFPPDADAQSNLNKERDMLISVVD